MATATKRFVRHFVHTMASENLTLDWKILKKFTILISLKVIAPSSQALALLTLLTTPKPMPPIGDQLVKKCTYAC